VNFSIYFRKRLEHISDTSIMRPLFNADIRKNVRTKVEQEVLAGFELVLSAVSVKNKFTKNRKKA
jgi:hypothetical protein